MILKKLFILYFSLFTNILVLQSQVLKMVNIDTTKRNIPSFELEDINFKKIKQTDLIGKVVVLNFWGISCPSCIEEIPSLNRVVKKIKSENVVFIAICPSNQRGYKIDKYEEVRKFLKTKEFLYRICPTEDFGSLGAKFNVKYVPTHFIIDKYGYIIYKYVGEISENDFINTINKALRKGGL